MLKSAPLSKCFKSCKGKELSFAEAVVFVQTRFELLHEKHRAEGDDGERSKLFVHKTVATDTQSVREAFEDVAGTVLMQNVSAIME